MHDSHAILNETDLALERTPAELLAWIGHMDEHFRAMPRKECHAVLKTRLGKKFQEESRPLSLLAKATFLDRPGITLRLCPGNQSYDAIVRDTSCCPAVERKIEFVKAEDGYQEHLRMIELERKGHVSAIARVTHSGTKHRGYKIDVPNEFVEASKLRAERYAQIKQAGEKKAAKGYGPDVWLVIVFDDYAGFHNQSHIQELRHHCEQTLSGLDWRTEKVVVLGIGGRAYVEFDTSPGAMSLICRRAEWMDCTTR